MKRVFDVVVERDEGGWYVAKVPALPGCVTQGRTLAALRKNVVEAIELYLEEPEGRTPASTFIGIERVEVSA